MNAVRLALPFFIITCTICILTFLSVTPKDDSPDSLLVLGPLGLDNFGFVLGLSGADSVLAQLRYTHMEHIHRRPRRPPHTTSQPGELTLVKRFARPKRTIDQFQGRMQELSSQGDDELDADDPRYSNRVWKHQEPENNTFADLEVGFCSLLSDWSR